MQPKRKIGIGILLCSLQAAIAGSQLAIGERLDRPAGFGFLFFVAAVVLVGLVVILFIDLFTSRTVTLSGKIVHIRRNIIAIVCDENKLRRYKIHEQSVLDKLEVEQQVMMTLTQIARIPASIAIVDSGQE